MKKFLDREEEIKILNNLIMREGSHLVMMYGRRRVGKTTLLVKWAEQAELSLFYWVAKRDTKADLMSSLAQAIYAWEHGLDFTTTPIRPQSWEEVFHMLAQAIGEQRVIVILDELPYILEQDSGFGTHLQAAWDHLFQNRQAIVMLSGSHIGMLTQLTTYHAPLYGRLTAQFPLYPLRFEDIGPFLARYDLEKQLAVFAILGGVPAYLEHWNDKHSIGHNIERLFLQRTGWFRNEPHVLISDLTQREVLSYEAIITAIADGYHGRSEIAKHADIPSTNLSHYLPRLLDLHFIERRIPATTPLKKLKTANTARYHLRDHFLRFYYRFVDPNLHLIERGLSNRLWQMMSNNLRAFVAYAFEDICRDWVVEQAQHGDGLPFSPDNVGSHWSKHVQIDVVAINWQERQLLLGECKWGDRPVAKRVLTELVEEKTPKLFTDMGEESSVWTVHTMLFARHSFTSATQKHALETQTQLITLAEMMSSI